MILTGSLFHEAVRCVAIALMLVLPGAWAVQAQTPPELERRPFLISSGPVGGSSMQLGEAIAITVSHPPGLGRCEGVGICGPKGLIATTRSSAGSVAGALGVARGNVQSALLHGDILTAAAQGGGPFASEGPLKDLRVMARLHDEALHFVVPASSRIRRLADLRGRRIAVDAGSTDTAYTVRALLRAAGVSIPARNLRAMSVAEAAEALRTRKVSAAFVLGVAPMRALDPLFRRGELRLLPIGGRSLQRLKRTSPLYGTLRIPAGTYRSTGAVETLGVASVWVVHRSFDAAGVEQILRAFWARENRRDIEARVPFASGLDIRNAASVGGLPLHEGAKRFYGARRP
jgi:TRAP transporter TAXI family solute receptor